MPRTLSQLRDLVKENIHNDTSITNAEIDSWINLAQDEVEKNFLSRYLVAHGNFVVEANTAEYIIHEIGFRSLNKLWDEDNNIVLTPASHDTIRANEPDWDATGRPRMWVFLKFLNGFPVVRLWPVPNAIYTIQYEYFQNLPDLVADNDYSLISELGWDSLLLSGASKYYYRIHGAQDYEIWLNEFQSDLRDFRGQFEPQVGRDRMMNNVLRGTTLSAKDLFMLPEKVNA